MGILNPVEALLDRLTFISGVEEIARLSGSDPKKIEDIKSFIWDSVVEIDNQVISDVESGKRVEEIVRSFNKRREDLINRVSLMLGIKIKFI